MSCPISYRRHLVGALSVLCLPRPHCVIPNPRKRREGSASSFSPCSTFKPSNFQPSNFSFATYPPGLTPYIVFDIQSSATSLPFSTLFYVLESLRGPSRGNKYLGGTANVDSIFSKDFSRSRFGLMECFHSSAAGSYDRATFRNRH